jgi:prepilin-type processing-associated H-X9-DG protein
MNQSDAATMALRRCADEPRHARVLPALYQRTTVDQRASVLLDPAPQARIHAESLDWYFPPATAGGRGPTTAQRMASYREHAPPLAAEACRRALTGARIDARRITHLVTVTCTGFASPGVEHQLVEALGLSPDTQRTQVGFMGCHGALNGLRVAGALAAAEREARVLVVCVELCSLHFQYGWHSERVVANALFADGAAAAVVGQDASAGAAWAIADTASRIFPDAHNAMTWHIGDHGFEMTLSSKVPSIIRRQLGPWLSEWLDRHALTIDKVGSFAVHPGGPRIVAAVADALGLDDADVADSRHVLEHHGNMSSATLLFVLERMLARHCAAPCVAMSFGPGLAGEAALLTK